MFYRAWVVMSVVLSLCAGVATPVRADVRTEARRHFRDGMQLVEEGRYEEGIEQLLTAYDTLPHPNVLYNVATAYSQAGQYEAALEYFERYLALAPDAEDRGYVQGYIEELEDERQ